MNSRAGTMQTGTASRKKPWRLWCPIVMRDGRATLPEIKLDRVPASVTRTYPREIPKLMVGFAVVFIVGIVAIFLLINQQTMGRITWEDAVAPYVLGAFAVAEFGPVVLLLIGLWRLLRREQIVVDLHEVAVRRRWLFWSREWRRPLNGYDGIALMRTNRLGFSDTGDYVTERYKPVHIVVLQHRERKWSIVLAAAPAGAPSKAMWNYYREFLPAAGERDPLGTFDSIWLRAPRHDDVSPAPAIEDPDLPGDPVEGRWDRLGVIMSVLFTIAAAPVLLAWGPAAVGLLIAASAIPSLIRGKAFIAYGSSSVPIFAKFLEGLSARLYAILIALAGIGWYYWFDSQMPISEWTSVFESFGQFRRFQDVAKGLSGG